MMRKGLRVALWGIKGVLMVVALGALLVWPWSYGHYGWVQGQRWIVEPDHARVPQIAAGCFRGRVRIGWGADIYTKPTLNDAAHRAAAEGSGWRWRTYST